MQHACAMICTRTHARGSITSKKCNNTSRSYIFTCQPNNTHVPAHPHILTHTPAHISRNHHTERSTKNAPKLSNLMFVRISPAIHMHLHIYSHQHSRKYQSETPHRALDKKWSPSNKRDSVLTNNTPAPAHPHILTHTPHISVGNSTP